MSRRTVILSTLLIIISTCSLFIDKIFPLSMIQPHAEQVHVAGINMNMIHSHFDQHHP